MTPLKKLFKRGLSWSIVESIFSQTMLTAHTIALFNTIPNQLYGINGVIFSLMYTIIGLSTAGIDSAIGATKKAALSKEYISKTIKEQLMITVAIMSCCMIITLSFYKNVLYKDFALLGLIGIIIIAESLKKTAKAFFALEGNFHTNFTIECTTIALYVISVWSLYYTYEIITLKTLIVPLSVITLIITMSTYKHLYNHYKKAPSSKSDKPIKGVTIRIQALSTYASHIIYSSNILIPIVAGIMGTQQAGFFKLVSNCMHSLIAIIEKTYGLMSTVLLSHTENKQTALNLINRNLLPYINFLMPALLIAFYLFIPSHRPFVPFVGAYMVLHISNILATSSERLILDKKHGHILLWGNSIVLSFVFFIIFCNGYSYFLWIAAMSRILYNILIALYSYKKWNIKAYKASDCNNMATAASLMLLIVFLS